MEQPAETDEDDGRATLAMPPLATLDAAPGLDTFLLEGAEGNLWFERRGPVLFVTFDNLATLDTPYPRQPWMHARVASLGYSLLGVQSFRKDWFRQASAPDLIRGLQQRGFFAQFDKVVLVGASMGGFAALNFAPLIPGAQVLAFSPQSTMSRDICPFEKRFSHPVTRMNWTDQPFLDAAAAIPYVQNAVILYDPFVPEDRLHAARLKGPGVRFLRLGHSSHQAIRTVVKSDALPQMLREFAETGDVGAEFWRNLRRRKGLRTWRRNFIETLAQRNHPQLLLRACDYMLADGDYLFARTARRKVLEQHPDLARGRAQ